MGRWAAEWRGGALHRVGGVAMSGLATASGGRGVRVRGSDRPFYPPASEVLAAAAIEVRTPYAAQPRPTGGRRPRRGRKRRLARKPGARARARGAPPLPRWPRSSSDSSCPPPRQRVAGTHGKDHHLQHARLAAPRGRPRPVLPGRRRPGTSRTAAGSAAARTSCWRGRVTTPPSSTRGRSSCTTGPGGGDRRGEFDTPTSTPTSRRSSAPSRCS